MTIYFQMSYVINRSIGYLQCTKKLIFNLRQKLFKLYNGQCMRVYYKYVEVKRNVTSHYGTICIRSNYLPTHIIAYIELPISIYSSPILYTLTYIQTL